MGKKGVQQENLTTDQLDAIQRYEPKKSVNYTLLHSDNLVSQFTRLSPQELEIKKKLALNPIQSLDSSALIVDLNTYYPIKNQIDFPKRPKWSKEMSKIELETNEQIYFDDWLKSITKTYQNQDLSFFEHNLQVWRQLWRTLEISDILLIVCDIRDPLFHFPPTLYNHIIKQLQKSIVVVFNKIDLVDKDTLLKWKLYFQECFPEIKIIQFSSIPNSQMKGYRSIKRYVESIGVLELLEACADLHVNKPNVNLDWNKIIEEFKIELDERKKIADKTLLKIQAGRAGLSDHKVRHGRRRKQIESMESDSEKDSEPETTEDEKIQKVQDQLESLDIADDAHKYITIGLIGHPNGNIDQSLKLVGKSSLINSIKGKKFVSVSKTPGHTKHFQTIHLTDQLRLCDCPGLVFPSLIPRHLQVISGVYNIAQVQEPYSAIRFVAERCDIPTTLKLTHPDQDEHDFHWSPWTICEAIAFQKGFLSAKSGRPDVHRAANNLLRMIVEGQIVLSLKPPNIYDELSDSSIEMMVESHDSIDDNVGFNQISKKAEKKRRKEKNKLKKLATLS
ncbi:P-loop containing nucleoside triphosphate hydrolase protein [Globomyces pollinis-pini]|nr:P-loop containing nucleoside triphosphate hydrolase protein [Globomyces pollinis-pini]